MGHHSTIRLHVNVHTHVCIQAGTFTYIHTHEYIDIHIHFMCIYTWENLKSIHQAHKTTVKSISKLGGFIEIIGYYHNNTVVLRIAPGCL